MPPLPITGLSLLDNKRTEDVKSPEQIQCESDGGRWDLQGLKCIFPAPEKPEPIGDVKATIPEIIRDEDTGKPSAITLPSGSTFFGTQKELDELASSKAARDPLALPAGTAEFGSAQATARETQRKLFLAKNVGQIDFELAAQIEEQGLSIKQVIAAGIQGIDLKQAGGVAAGAAIFTAPAAVPTGGLAPAAVAAIAGGSTLVLDFINDVRANVKEQRQDLVTVKTKELKKRMGSMQNYISAANANPAGADEFVLAYNLERSLIRRDFNTLMRGEEHLEILGTDATKQIVEYEVFFQSLEPSLDIRMQQAILKPDPTRAFLSLGDEE